MDKYWAVSLGLMIGYNYRCLSLSTSWSCDCLHKRFANYYGPMAKNSTIPTHRPYMIGKLIIDLHQESSKLHARYNLDNVRELSDKNQGFTFCRIYIWQSEINNIWWINWLLYQCLLRVVWVIMQEVINKVIIDQMVKTEGWAWSTCKNINNYHHLQDWARAQISHIEFTSLGREALLSCWESIKWSWFLLIYAQLNMDECLSTCEISRMTGTQLVAGGKGATANNNSSDRLIRTYYYNW